MIHFYDRNVLVPMQMILRNETPTKREPRSPGPLVNATASISSFFILASLMALSTTGIIFC